MISTNAERWLPVVGWETIYEVSTHGRVKRVASGKCAVVGRVLRPFSQNGYQVVRFRYRGRSDRPLVHRVVAAAFLGPPPDGHEVNHKDADRWNPRLSNLEYVTRSENHLHAFRVTGNPARGIVLSSQGTQNVKAKLTEQAVVEIRRRYDIGDVSQQALATEFGVNQTLIGFIVRRVIWTHV